jgi:hypothetical protein
MANRAAAVGDLTRNVIGRAIQGDDTGKFRQRQPSGCLLFHGGGRYAARSEVDSPSVAAA